MYLTVAVHFLILSIDAAAWWQRKRLIEPL
jgi:hypothetical protein